MTIHLRLCQVPTKGLVHYKVCSDALVCFMCVYMHIYVASSVEMTFGYWDRLCVCAHLDTLPSYVWGTHVALDHLSNFWYAPFSIAMDYPMW